MSTMHFGNVSREFKALLLEMAEQQLHDTLDDIEQYSGKRPVVILPNVTVPEAELITIPFSEIEPEQVSWVWPRRVIQGKLNMLVGHPDSGKSFIAVDMAARVSTGKEWPDESGTAPLGDVLILAAEDDPADTIRPRLEAHGADLSRVHFVKGMRHPGGPRIVQLDIDYWHLESKIREVGAALVDIDPLVSFVSQNVKPNDELAVRRLLQPLADMAARTGVAIVGIMHLNKKPDLEKIQRVGGAMAFVGMVRSALYVERNEKKQDTFTLSTLKLNLAKKPPALSYHIQDANPGTGSDVGRLVWDDQLIDPDDLERGRPVPSELDRTIALLEEILPVYQPDIPGVPTVDVNSRAQAAGISKPTLERARSKRGVISKRVGNEWQQWLPAPAFATKEIRGEGDEGLEGLE